MRTMSAETVRDAMVPEPTTLGAGASAQEAGHCFADNGDVRAIFVTEDGGGLLGVVTRKTLVREVVAAGLDPRTVTLREIAEPPNFTLDAGLEEQPGTNQRHDWTDEQFGAVPDQEVVPEGAESPQIAHVSPSPS